MTTPTGNIRWSGGGMTPITGGVLVASAPARAATLRAGCST